MVVNGVGGVIAFVPTTGGTPMSSTLTVELRKGANTVRFEAVNGGWGEFSFFFFGPADSFVCCCFWCWVGLMLMLMMCVGPDIDRLMVPVS